MVQKCEERFNDNTQFPVFMHLKDDNDQHMIVIRGTSQKKDFYQDLVEILLNFIDNCWKFWNVRIHKYHIILTT